MANTGRAAPRELRVVLLTAFDPWAVGNGSSMRARRWCEALESCGSLQVRVVPVVASNSASPYVRVILPDDDEAARNVAHLMSVRWRDWMVRAAPLPPAAASAPAWLGSALVAELPWKPDVVVAFKMAVAPMAADLAQECGVPLVVDLDDDEAELARACGDEQAAALERLLQGVGELAVTVTMASPLDAATVAPRVRAAVQVVPNTVELPDLPEAAGMRGRALYVANFGYRPNREAARWLLDAVVPHIEGLQQLTLVGALGDRLDAGAPVVALGRVDDPATHYRDASVALCPVLTGSGTSIKVIEAMAHGRAVVTTSVGARGLGLVPGEHAVVVDHATDFAAAVTRLLADPDSAAALGIRGRAVVAARYSAAEGVAAMTAAVGAAVGDFGR
ncbi:MAG: glycosyltransferase family 4 protein [Actinomycetota bacterium]|nr:glycosyltransferase family 4 protein [Actinomycetota bacterium]